MTAWLHRGICLLLTCIFLSGCSDNDSPLTALFRDDPEPVIWRFSLEELGGSVQDAWAQEFRERIEDLSDGAIRVEIYPYGSIGTSPQLTNLIQAGRVHLGFATPGHLADTIPEAGIFLLPFLFPDHDDDFRRVLADPDVNRLLAAAWQDQGLQLLGIVPEGWMTWTANRPLRSPADFTGLRLRTMTATLHGSLVRAWGGEPVAMAYADVYQALQLGQVDGQANPLFAVSEMKFYEVQSVLTQPRASRFVTTLVSNPQWYQSLEPAHREWLHQARDGMPEFIDRIQQEYNERSLQELQESGGLRIVSLTDAERARFREASLAVRDTYRQHAGERGRQLLDRVLSLTDGAPSMGEPPHDG